MLRPNSCKSDVYEESRCCITQQQQDIMQVNNEGDWVKGKEQVSLKRTKNQRISKYTSWNFMVTQ